MNSIGLRGYWERDSSNFLGEGEGCNSEGSSRPGDGRRTLRGLREGLNAEGGGKKIKAFL